MPRHLSEQEFNDFYDSKPGWVTLTTVGADGYPHSVPLGYFRDEDKIYCGVRDQTIKLRNIDGNSKVSLLIESGSTMSDIKGAMVQGEARVIREPEDVLRLMRIGATQRGVTEDDLPTEARPGAAFIEVTIKKRISWDYGDNYGSNSGD